MRCYQAVNRLCGPRRAFVAVLLGSVVYACDSGSFGSHSDRGPVKLVFTAWPTAAVANEPIVPVAVTVQDAYGNSVPGARVSITVAIGINPAGATLAGTTTVAASGGLAVFSDLVIDKAGTGYTLTAQSNGLIGATSAPMEVTGPVKLAFIAQPTSALAGAAMRPVVVAVQDKDGHDMPNAHASITVVIGANPGAGALSGTTTLPAVGGVAVFSDLVINNRGSGYTLAAVAYGLTEATSGPIEVTVSPPAAKLAFTTQPPDYPKGLTNQTISPAIQVSILDDSGNVVTSSTMDVTVAVATGPAGATMSGTVTVAAVNGVATFSDLRIDTAGWYTLAASACSLTVASTSFEILDASTLAPGCLSFPDRVSFGFQTIGTSSAPQAIKLTNTCAVEQYLGAGAFISSSFYEFDWSFRDDCPQLLGPGASCTFDVTFTPAGLGARTAYLHVQDDYPNQIRATLDGAVIGALSMSVAPDPSGASGGFAYVANANRGNVSMYRIDRDSGVLASLAPSSIPAGTNPASVAVDPSGKFVYVANAGANSISMYTIGADGLLASIGPPVATGTFPASVAVAPDPSGGPGRFAYVGNAGSNDVSMYRIDPGSGVLTLLGTIPVGTGALFVAVHPSGKFVYVGSDTGLTVSTHSMNSSIYTYSIDSDTGALTPLGLADPPGGDDPSSLAIDSSGKFVALTNRRSANMYLFNVDSATGPLSLPGSVSDLAARPTSVAISVRPSGKPFAYVTYGSGSLNNSDNSVFAYGIDTSIFLATSLAGTAAAGSSPISIAIDPSGRFAYVANSGSGDISMYGINADGTLTPLVPATIGI